MNDARFSLITALHAVCSAYHSGQWSRGYRILSRIETAYSPRNLPDLNTIFKNKNYEHCETREIARTLVKKYRNAL